MKKLHFNLILALGVASTITGNAYASRFFESLQRAGEQVCTMMSPQFSDLIEEEKDSEDNAAYLSPWSWSRWKYWPGDSWDIIKQILSGKVSEVAEVTACCPFLNNVMLQPLIADTRDNLRVAEFGFGRGTMTRDIIGILGSKANCRFDAIECNTDLCKRFSDEYKEEHTTFPAWVHVHDKYVQDWHPEEGEKYDHIVCTLPFMMLTKDVVESILQKSKVVLAQGGTFSFVSLLGARSRMYIETYVKAAFARVAQRLGRNTAQQWLQVFSEQRAKAKLLDEWEYSGEFEVQRTCCHANITSCWVHTLTFKGNPDNENQDEKTPAKQVIRKEEDGITKTSGRSRNRARRSNTKKTSTKKK